ncbi:dihydrofolate reductase family protein [Flexithrix dorotheae]|uniref:dihydrofolate reductase family protein n=1 Tax=Flexithrix dorotheae TaxID=70993 RepID=UPI000368F5E5|nr:dihydrofolate reductase family protein [Flexithrix dorotheae]
MKPLILYIATSLDGYIARKNGAVDWLPEGEEGDDYGYQAFYDGIDTVLMGNKTYQQLLSFGVEYPYKGTEGFIFTRNMELTRDENVTYIQEDIVEFTQKLKQGEGKGIWLIGGGEIIKILLEADLVDELIIFEMPVLLGNGIPLFPESKKEIKLKLEESKTYSGGIVELKYKTLG